MSLAPHDPEGGVHPEQTGERALGCRKGPRRVNGPVGAVQKGSLSNPQTRVQPRRARAAADGASTAAGWLATRAS